MANLKYRLTTTPEIPVSRLQYWDSKSIYFNVYERSSFNPQARITGFNYASMPLTSGGGNTLTWLNLSSGATYDVFYKDDIIPEQKIGTVYIVPLNENCYTQDSEVIAVFIYYPGDGTWRAGFTGQSTPVSKQFSLDGGATYKTVDTFSQTWAESEVPNPLNMVVRAINYFCSYNPIQSGYLIAINEAPACTLEYDNPAFIKTNESGPDANDGAIRVKTKASTVQGTLLHRLTKPDGTVVRPYQASDLFANLEPGLYNIWITDDVCGDIKYPDSIGVAEFVSDPVEQSPSRTRDYINNPNFTRFYFTFGMSLGDFQNFDGALPPPSDEVINVPEVESAIVRVTESEETRITEENDRRVL